MPGTNPLTAAAIAALFLISGLSAQSRKQDLDLTAPDGLKLKATYYSAGRPGPGVLLLHQCNRDRKTWDSLATQLAETGINVLTMDYRGFGESGGDRYDMLTGAQRGESVKKWPGDIDAAYKYLLSQPGVDKAHIGAGGASCGVNNSVLLATRHPEVRTLVLLSGRTSEEGRAYMQAKPFLSLFIAASRDDGGVLPYMRWLGEFSHNPDTKVVGYEAAGHGTEMFAVEKELPGLILKWYQAELVKPTTRLAKDRKPNATEEFWTLLNQSDGVARARQAFEGARQKDPNVLLFPEEAINNLGYERMAQGKNKEAIEILKLNEMAYPRSANVYDSLSDAYMADHQDAQAIAYAERALKILEMYPVSGGLPVRESAEAKLKKLKKE